jgi:hypothetical protein
LQRGDPLVGRGDQGLAGEDLLGQHAVHLGVAVRAGVGEHGEAKVEVGRLAHRGQYDAAGGNTREDQTVGGRAAQQDVKIRAAERADPPLYASPARDVIAEKVLLDGATSG